MSSESLHEPTELLSEPTRNMHRAITTLIEELEAVDWYNQRAEACSDPELASVIRHNQREEIEHAMMTLEWIRRQNPDIDAAFRRFLDKTGPIVSLEKEEGGDESGKSAAKPAVSVAPSLGIGSLRSQTGSAR